MEAFKKIIIILFIMVCLGCITVPEKQNIESSLIFISNSICTQDWNKNTRSYHLKDLPFELYTDLARILYGTVGIQAVTIKPYEIKIFKSPLFDWKIIDLTIVTFVNNKG